MKNASSSLESFSVLELIKCDFHTLPATKEEDTNNKYFMIPARPATGVLYITCNNREFISGHVRLRGKDEGRYPYNYLEMIENIFGQEDNTIEVCSRSVSGINGSHSSYSFAHKVKMILSKWAFNNVLNFYNLRKKGFGRRRSQEVLCAITSRQSRCFVN